MKGFFLRDLDLILPNLKFSAAFLVIWGVVMFFSSSGPATFILLYLAIFFTSSILGLFNYDEANHWQAYAAAIPGGRRAMVDGRYALSLLAAAVVTLLTAVSALLEREPAGLVIALLYGGLVLAAFDVMLPLSYRFGGTRSRTIMIVAVAGLAAAVAVLGSIGGMSALGGDVWMPAAGILMIAAGLAGAAVSRKISRNIMEKKDL